MIRYRINGGNFVQPNVINFPDGTFKIDLEDIPDASEQIEIVWNYGGESEQNILYYLASCFKEIFPDGRLVLHLPYLPNARMDRIHSQTEVFTLKYFCKMINSLGFSRVNLLDAHSNVGVGMLDRALDHSPKRYIEQAFVQNENMNREDLLFFPDEGAMKRYANMFDMPNVGFGIKQRDWATGQIKGLDIQGAPPEGKRVFIIDDICAYGGTVFHTAKKLKESGAAKIYVFFTHCENSIAEGKLFGCGLIDKIYTTDSLCTLPDSELFKKLRIGYENCM